MELGPGQIAVTSDLTLNYLRPMYPNSGRLTADARVIEVGRRLGLAEALIRDTPGKAVAHSTTRCFIQSFPAPERTELAPVEAPTYAPPDPHERPLTAGLAPPEVLASTSFIEVCNMMTRGDLPTPPFAEFLALGPPVAEPGSFSTSQLR